MLVPWGLLPGKSVSFCFCRTVMTFRKKHCFCIKAKLPITASCKEGGWPRLRPEAPQMPLPLLKGLLGWAGLKRQTCEP